MFSRRAFAGACLALAAACARPPQTPLKATALGFSRSTAATAIRLPGAGGAARLYSLPALDPDEWKSADRLPAAAAVAGASREPATVYVQTAGRALVGVDLQSRRTRTLATSVVLAALGPDGTPYGLDTGGVVTRYTRRAAERYRAEVALPPTSLHATVNGSVLALGAGSLAVLAPDDTVREAALPRGATAVAPWSDLLAVATDSGTLIYDPQRLRVRRLLKTSGRPRATAFSPSGHQIYVVGDTPQLTIFDRFELERVGRIPLPGPARGIRAGPYGRWLLVRPARGDSVWVVDLEADSIAGAVATPWAADLPAVTPSQTLLLRRGDDVVARDLGRRGFPVAGTVTGGAADRWLALDWSPAAPPEPESVLAAQPAAPGEPSPDSAAGADSAAAPAEPVYLQVSSSQNPEWARELSTKLSGAGLPARVLEPRHPDEPYRVVLGPYPSRAAGEAAGRTLGMPFFVLPVQEATAQ